MSEKTYRIFSIVAYDESDNLSYSDIFNSILLNKFKYIIIKHKPESNEKKEHYHIALYFDKPTTIKVVSNKLDIPSNYIEVLTENKQRYTLKKTIGYFLHYNNNDKINYNVNDIITNIQDVVNKYYDILTGGSNESNELKEIIAFATDNFVNIKDVLMFCIDNNYLKTFKKYSYILNQIVLRKEV